MDAPVADRERENLIESTRASSFPAPEAEAMLDGVSPIDRTGIRELAKLAG